MLTIVGDKSMGVCVSCVPLKKKISQYLYTVIVAAVCGVDRVAFSLGTHTHTHTHTHYTHTHTYKYILYYYYSIIQCATIARTVRNIIYAYSSTIIGGIYMYTGSFGN